MPIAETSSWVRFQKGQNFSPITTQSHINMNAMSSGPGWLGLHMEIGTTSNGWNGDDLTVDGHFLCLNSTNNTLNFQMRDEGDSTWHPFIREPGAFWIHPEGRPFSLRTEGHSEWVSAIIDGKFLDSILGQHYELRGGVNVVDKLLEHLLRALIEEIHAPSPLHVRESLVRSFILALGTRYGVPAKEISSKGGLGATQLNALLAWVDDNLDKRLTVGAMASRVELSVAHFSREFKRSTGATPWDYIIEKRLQRAGKLLKRGESACLTALQCGFFDQAHLSRLFKQRFGFSPSAYAKRRDDQNVSNVIAC